MRKKIEWLWEMIDQKQEDKVFYFATYRAKVIGGWLVRNFDVTYNAKSTSESMVFVPDPNHDWVIVAPFDPAKKDEAKADAEEFVPPS